MPAYVLDSYALLAYFNAEASGSSVLQLFQNAFDGQIDLYLSQINLGEVYYIIRRGRNRKDAQAAIDAIQSLPITLSEVDQSRILAAAELKAQYPISYADAFAAALANGTRTSNRFTRYSNPEL
jgi:ribonuclease VapC